MLTRSSAREKERERAEAARATAQLIAETNSSPQLESTVAAGTVTVTPDDADTQPPSRDPSESARAMKAEPDNSGTPNSEERAIPRIDPTESGRPSVEKDAEQEGYFRQALRAQQRDVG